MVLSHHSRWEPLEGEGGPGELPRQWTGVSVCLSQSVGLASLACVKSWVSCPAPQTKNRRKITRAQSKPPVSTPWHVDLEALCGLFMAFLEKETQRLFRQELYEGEERRKNPWVTLMRWCFSLLRPQCGVCKTPNPCITVGAWAFSKEKCHNFN